MLTFLGFAMVITFMFLIMTKRLSALIALIIIPILFALFGGFAPKIGPMMLEGITKLAPTGVMLMFAILYFALMIDSGLFDPAVRKILKLVKGDPLKVSVGTAVLALVVSLDGDGATTYMICVAAMLPLYSRIGMSPRIMAGLIILAGGVMNMTPWGGPTARAASSLQVDPSDIFVPSGFSGTASPVCMRSRVYFSSAPSLPPGCSTLKSTDVKPRPSSSAIASASPSASIISEEVVGARLCGQASRAFGSVSATSAALASVDSRSAVIAIRGMRKRLA